MSGASKSANRLANWWRQTSPPDRFAVWPP